MEDNVTRRQTIHQSTTSRHVSSTLFSACILNGTMIPLTILAIHSSTTSPSSTNRDVVLTIVTLPLPPSRRPPATHIPASLTHQP
ncbi:hypothetical protein EJ06DRAFT_230872 [Trichodelitschia bisporula]|uniref:Uncharacterized protein n=1 Tax=Trichodelitschia bisporula TaxID=703511 RepID=A0A6G1HKW5_9PEZI|nr:hypothetical protein EJ06DRAFT_230872 [Trichodelitschia bisporula]